MACREDAGQGPKVLLTSSAVAQVQVSSKQSEPKHISQLVHEKLDRKTQETSRITCCGWSLPKQQRTAANEPSANANMFGDHAETDFTATNVEQLTLISTWFCGEAQVKAWALGGSQSPCQAH